MPESKSVNCGFSLIEMLVAVAILSILAVVAIPYAQKGQIRSKEVELRRSLREIRMAIDRFHDDCTDGYILKAQDGVSRYCYPETLLVLVDGVQGGETATETLRYLRRIPRDPFLEKDLAPEENWLYRGYTDDPDSTLWNNEDVYDILVTHDRKALDGSYYSEW